MIRFTVTSAGTTALNNATAGTSPVLIDSLTLYNGENVVKTITTFTGSVNKDFSGIGDYVVIEFEDADINAWSVTKIGLSSSSTEIAYSEPLTITKRENKDIHIRLTAQFDNAYKCSFDNIHCAIPYATKFREGVLRLAKSTGETNKDYTVYSATDVETLINSHSVDSNLYVPWDKDGNDDPIEGETTISQLTLVDDVDTPTKTAVIATNGSTGNVTNISVGGYITGTAVSSSPTISSGAITGSSKLVNETYLSSLYANEVTAGNNTKLVTAYAVSEYVEDQLDAIDDDYVHIEGAESISGEKTFTGGIVANSSITGTGVYSSYDATSWANTSNNGKIPTLSTVRSAISTAENGLQEQIDAINAGQNLADIVDLCADLQSHPLTGLKARGDTGISIGDKVQVLHDKTKSDGTQDPTATGISTVYELVKGTIDTSTYPKDKASTATGGTGYYWHYIGEYGVDSYTKSESDNKYVAKSGLDQLIESTSSTTNAPSTKAVYDYVDDVIDDLDDDYVTLTTAQTITGLKKLTTSVDVVSADSATNSYATLSANGGTSQTSSSSSLQFTDAYNTKSAGLDFESQRNNLGSHLNISNSTYNTTTLYVETEEKIHLSSDHHYGCSSQDVLMSFEDVIPGAFYDFAIDYLSKLNPPQQYQDTPEGYDARIRLRKTISDDNDSNLIYNGEHTFVDLYADHVTTLSNDVHFKYLSSGIPTDLLKINSTDGVYSTRFKGGYEIGNTQYSFGTAGSLTFETSITNAADNTHLPTSKAVKDYVDAQAASSVEVISNTNALGCVGLFMYSEVGAQKLYGETVDGAYLKPVGLSLPLSGEIAYKAVDSVPAMSGTWKLMSVAFARTATSPCLVMAQKISNDTPSNGNG